MFIPWMLPTSTLEDVIDIVGTLCGMTNMLATVPGFLGPMVVGSLTQDNVSYHPLSYILMSISVLYYRYTDGAD